VNLSTSAVKGKAFTIADLSMEMLWVNRELSRWGVLRPRSIVSTPRHLTL
jgi:hypothetical protein